ncbi:MAG: sulfotransferase [Geminicoccaceae bacterium]
MLPNLFVVGADRGAIGLLRAHLAGHSEIFVPRAADPSYFTFAGGVPEFARPDLGRLGLQARRALRRELHADAITEADAYLRLYRNAGVRPVRADLSSAHLDSLAAASRIRGLVPEARIVAILRQPVDRAHGRFTAMRRAGLEPLASLAEALAVEPHRQLQGWAPGWLYARGGYYHRQLEPYVRFFGRERVHVLLVEDLVREPDAAMRALCRFVGVAQPKPAPVSIALEPATGSAQTWLGRLSGALLGHRAAIADPSCVTARAILAERYAPDIARLEALLGQHLSAWAAPQGRSRAAEPVLDAPALALAA